MASTSSRALVALLLAGCARDPCASELRLEVISGFYRSSAIRVVGCSHVTLFAAYEPICDRHVSDEEEVGPEELRDLIGDPELAAVFDANVPWYGLDPGIASDVPSYQLELDGRVTHIGLACLDPPGDCVPIPPVIDTVFERLSALSGQVFDPEECQPR